MIEVFLGTVGSGKTLSMVYEGYKYYRRGLKIYANFKLNFPYEPLTYKRLNEMIQNKEQLQDAVLLLDEIHIAIDSRNSMSKKNKIISYFILQTRKRNVRLLYTTQHLHQVDRRLRDTTDILVMCDNMTNKTSLVNSNGKDIFIRQSYVLQWKNDARPRTKIIYANPVFPLFDTKEMIDFDDDS